MENNEHNELDSFFRKRLKNAGDQVGSWNTPPVSVFDDAISQINGSNSKKRRVIWFLAILSFIVLVVFVAWSLLKIDNLSSKLEASENANASLQNSNNYRSSQMLDVNVDSNSKYSEGIKSNSFPNNNYADIEGPNGSLSSVSHFKAPVQNPNLNKPEVLPNTLKLLNESDFTSSTFYVKSELLLAEFDIKGRYFLLSLYNRKENIAGQRIPFLPMHLKKEKQLKVIMKLGPEFSSLSMSSPDGLSDKLTKYDKNYAGFQLGVGIRNQVTSKLRLETMLNFKALTNQSQYKTEHTYKKTNEFQSQNGQLTYASMVDIESPMGVYNEEFVMTLNGNSIADKQELIQATDISSNLSVVNVDLGLAYSLVKKNAWDFYVQTDIGANYILQITEKMESKMYLNEIMIDKNLFSKIAIDKVNPIFVTGSLSLGVNRHFANGVFVGSKVGYNGSFNSIRKVDPNVGVTTHIKSLSGKIVIGLSL